MNTKETISGHEVNVIRSKSGEAREACVMLGPADKPGFRAQDGAKAKAARKAAKVAVADALGLPLAKVRAASRYTELTEQADGSITRRDSEGNVIGVYQQN